jgi:hypothetical protein
MSEMPNEKELRISSSERLTVDGESVLGARAGHREPSRRKPSKRMSTRPPVTVEFSDSSADFTPEERWNMIAVAAYYRAEKRKFLGGDPAEDWLAAEAETDARIAGSRMPADWADTVEQMMQEWAKTYQKRWPGWTSTPTALPPGWPLYNHSPDEWEKTVDSWQRCFTRTLEAQCEWVGMWSKSIQQVDRAPSSVQELADRSQEDMQQWLDMQSKYWEQCFNFLRRSAPTRSPRVARETEKFLRPWRRAAGEAIEGFVDTVFGWTRDLAHRKLKGTD